MKTFGLALLLLTFSPDWATTATAVSKSVVFITTTEGACTGFVINANPKPGKDHLLTAAHCDGKELFADSVPARVIWKDAKRDLMVLEVDDLDRPALTLAVKNPNQGDEIGSLGFGYALETPMFRIAHVANAALTLPDVEGGPFVAIDAAYVGGMSGGAVVNHAGEVVSIVQRSSGLMGIGIGVEAIRNKIGRFLPKTP